MMSMMMTMMNCDKHYGEHIDEIVYNGIAECGNIRQVQLQRKLQQLNLNHSF